MRVYLTPLVKAETFIHLISRYGIPFVNLGEVSVPKLLKHQSASGNGGVRKKQVLRPSICLLFSVMHILDHLAVILKLLRDDSSYDKLNLKIDEAIEAVEIIKTPKIAMETFSKLPIYRSKGVWIEGDEGPRCHAITWAYNYYSGSENTRRFMVNAVAAVFDYELIQQCCQKCEDDGPCANCGNWEWVTDPLTPNQKNWMGEPANGLDGPGSLITKEATRCAASMIISTKADFWCSGPNPCEELTKKDLDVIGIQELEIIESNKSKIHLGEHATAMLKDLYPGWNIIEASEPVLTAGLWANTRHILKMIGNTPLPPCVPLWGSKESVVKSLGPEMKKALTNFPAGTEDLLDFIKATKELLESPLILYFPNAEDLLVLQKAEESVKQYPFNYHKCSKSLGMEPMNEYDIYSVVGRLGAFHLAKSQGEVVLPEKSFKKAEECQDYHTNYAETCRAYFGLYESTMEAAIILFKARPMITVYRLVNLLEAFEMEMTTEQKNILEIANSPIQ